MNDMARLLGALYRAGDAKKIVFDGKTYTWDADLGLKGSNWVDPDDNTLTLVKAIGIKVGGTVSASTEVELTVDGIDITFAVAEDK